jgi:phosphoribosylanthranilate isomerase
MTKTQFKICGLSTPDTIDAAVEGGATHVGFVHYDKSPRHLSLEEAAKLRRRVPANVKLVLVTVALEPENLARAYDAIKPDVIQFHGGETAEWMSLVKKSIPGVETWRALGLREKATLERSKQFIGTCDRLLFDAPAKALPGGNGTAFQWSLLDGWEPYMDWALAGGLTPENVADAARQTGAPLLDASSGIEIAPGVKSVDLIRAFCHAVRHI